MTGLSDFDDVDQVIADPIRLKLKLGIGEDAYTSLRMGQAVQKLWSVGTVAATGASIARTSTVASLFVKGGFWSAIGLAPAAMTPIGWVVAAAAVTAGGYYGVMNLARSYHGSRVQTIPKFINTPIDILGASLLDLMGTLAVKFARIDGRQDDAETAAIRDYFLEEWGFDPRYLDRALAVIEENSDKQTLKEAAAVLVEFAEANPDCNLSAVKAAILELLREIAQADGVLDEREEWALEKAERAFADARSSLLSRTAASVASAPLQAVSWARGRLGRGVRGPAEPDS